MFHSLFLGSFVNIFKITKHDILFNFFAGPGLPPPPPPGVSWGTQVKVSTGLLVTPSSVHHFRLWCLSGGCTSPSSQSDQGCPLLFLWALQQAWRVLLALLSPGEFLQ